LGASSRDKKKWLLIGLVLPVVSIVVLNVLARKGHFDKFRVTSPEHLPNAYEQNTYLRNGNAPTASNAPQGDYAGDARNQPAPASYSSQQQLAPHSSYNQPQPYSPTSTDYGNSSVPYGQQQGYGYPSQGYSSAAPPYNNVSSV
jgi:hypothetical protein